MPREVLLLQVGQCGLQVGKQVWRLFAAEHKIDLKGNRDKNENPPFPAVPSAFYLETDDNNFVPRAVLVDSEESVIDDIQYGDMKETFDRSYCYNAQSDSSNNFARGYFIALKAEADYIFNGVRKQVEQCESISTILTLHSTGGGTGSGFGSKAFEWQSDHYPKLTRSTVSVFPSSRNDTAVVSPYNAIFTAQHMLDHVDFSIAIQNEALYHTCDFIDNGSAITFQTINQIIAQTISTITSSLRYGEETQVDFSEFQTNLVPFPRISTLICSIAPLQPKRAKTIHPTTHSITVNAFENSNLMTCCDLTRGKFIASCLMYRGSTIRTQECVDAIWSLKMQSDLLRFVPWMSTGIKIGVQAEPMLFLDNSPFVNPKRGVIQIGNHTEIGTIYGDLIVKFDMLYSERGFIHWYIGQGMEEGDFSNARDLMSLIYADYKEADGGDDENRT